MSTTTRAASPSTGPSGAPRQGLARALVAVGLMILVCLTAIRWIFLTGWRLRE